MNVMLSRFYICSPFNFCWTQIQFGAMFDVLVKKCLDGILCMSHLYFCLVLTIELALSVWNMFFFVFSTHILHLPRRTNLYVSIMLDWSEQDMWKRKQLEYTVLGKWELLLDKEAAFLWFYILFYYAFRNYAIRGIVKLHWSLFHKATSLFLFQWSMLY